MAAPTLKPREQVSADSGNILADYAIKVMSAAAEVGVIAALEFPKDLGRATLGTPASVWRDSSLRALAEFFTRQPSSNQIGQGSTT